MAEMRNSFLFNNISDMSWLERDDLSKSVQFAKHESYF